MENKLSLYNIDKNIEELIEKGFTFNEETGEVIFEITDLNSLQEMKEEKVNSIIGYIKNLDLEINSFAEVMNDYKKRLDQRKKKREQLVQYLDTSMRKEENFSKREYKNGILSYKSSKALQVEDGKEEDLIKWLKEHSHEDCVKTEQSLKKDAIKKLINDDIKIPFAEIVANKNIQIN